MLAISSDSMQLGITPDYSKSPKQLFLDVSVSFLLCRKDTSALTLACLTDNLSDLTGVSWSIASPRLERFRSSAIASNVFTPHPNSNNPQRNPRFHTDETNSIITLTGSIVDHISLTTPPLYTPKSFVTGRMDRDYLDFCILLLKSMSEVLSNLGISAESAAALGLASVANPKWKPTPGRGSLTQRTAYHFWCYYRFVCKSIKEYSQQIGFDLEDNITSQFDHVIETLAPLLLETDLDTFSLAGSLSAAELDATSCIGENMLHQGRSFCTTKQGRICNCMNKIEAEDVIAAFRGADRLYVLRPAEGGRYRLVGGAYVHGLMFGEAYEGLDPDKVDYDIELI